METNSFLSMLSSQYKNIENKLDKLSDKMEILSTETAIQRNDIDSLKLDINDLKIEQVRLKNDLDKVQVIHNTTKSKRYDLVMNVIVKSIVTLLLSLIGAGVIATIIKITSTGGV